MGNDRAKVDQPQPQPQPPQVTPLPGTTDHVEAAKLDATKVAGLSLRSATVELHAALEAKTPAPVREAMILLRAEQLEYAFDESTQLASHHKIDWGHILKELDEAKATYGRTLAELVAPHEVSRRASLSTAFKRLGSKIDPRIWSHDVTVGPALSSNRPIGLSFEEEFTRGTQEIAATREACVGFRATAPKSKDEAVSLVWPMLVHLSGARDAMQKLPRDRKIKLRPHVKGLSNCLGELNSDLTASPRMPWDASFARLFDTENELREQCGLLPAARSYTGKADPAQLLASFAAKQVNNNSIQEPDTTTRKQEITTPAAAINVIGINVNYAYYQQYQAISALSSNLQEAAPPKDESTFDRLMQVATSLLFNAITVGLTRYFELSLDRSFTQSTAAGVERSMAQGLSVAERREQLSRSLEPTRIRRSVAAKVISDAGKTFFTSGLATLNKPPPSRATTLRNQFIQNAQHHVLQSQKLAAVELTNLAGALSHLDLDTLVRFAHSLDQFGEEAGEMTYMHAAMEWQNVKASAYDAQFLSFDEAQDPKTKEPTRKDPTLEGRVQFGIEEHIPGTLEIDLGVDNDQLLGPTIDAFLLRDGEHAVVQYLRTHPKRLSELKMHRIFQLNLDAGYGAPVQLMRFGVGAREGLQRATFSRHDLESLRAFMIARNPKLRVSKPTDAELIDRVFQMARTITDSLSTSRLQAG